MLNVFRRERGVPTSLVSSKPNTDRLFGREITNITEKPTQRGDRKAVNKSTYQKVTQLPKLKNNSIHLESQKNKLIDQEHLRFLFPIAPEFAAPYSGDIMKYLLSTEKEQPTQSFTKQRQVSQTMRDVLIEWLIDVHLRFKFFPQTLYLTVSLIDRYLEKVQISKGKFQLLGAACLFIGAKFEQIYRIPKPKDLVYMCANIYKSDQILQMQAQVLLSICFNIHTPNRFTFLTLFTRVCELDQKNTIMCYYIAQLSLLQYAFNRYKSSMLACSIVYLINKIRLRNKIHNQQLLGTHFDQEKVKVCAKELCNLIQTVDSKPYTRSIKVKYSSTEMKQVAKIRIQKRKQH